jgi:FAD/FMN-containing dehydrogenase
MAVRPPTNMPSAASTGRSTISNRPELFARALRGAKRELDPKGMLNPGVLIDP